MKTTKIIYWSITIIFSGFMIFSSIPDIMMVPEAVTYMNMLGYPNYFMPFIGVAKLLGVIAILIPGFPRIREWAYAGLAFDLIGATYSQLAVFGFQSGIFVMVLTILFMAISYTLHHRLNDNKA